MPGHFTTTIGALSLVALASTSHAAPPDACALLTPAQVGASVSASMGAGTALNSPTVSSCKWQQEGVDAFRAITVIMSTKSAEAYEGGKRIRQPVSVSGVGDEAYRTGDSLSYMVLSVKKGSNALTVTVRGLKDVPATQAAEKAIAAAAVGKL